MTKRAGRSAANDPGLAALVQRRRATAVCLVGKTWDYHVRPGARLPTEENLESRSRDCVRGRARGGKRGAVRRRALLRRLQGQPGLRAGLRWTRPYEAGARWVVLCDTNGGTLPDEVARDRAARSPSGIPGSACRHPHPQRHRQAVANTFAGIEAGARQVQGTLNGLGERCGNANLISMHRRRCC
ncbi:MAG: hypothetical protein U5L06_12880 [Rhodovibrio sp.]|nr:hypothetical protein [Rhodovibrio sp.]